MNRIAIIRGTGFLPRPQALPKCAVFSRGLPLDLHKASLSRGYASTTQGTPNATNLATPSPKPSDSPQEGDIKTSRADSGRAPQESGSSVAQPINQDNLTGKQQSMDEEGGDPMKNDPNKPAEQKKKETLQEGQKPLDPADK